MKKEKTLEQMLKEECQELLKEIESWKNICENGCSDPFWPDGTNMNLTRNHIIYHKTKIEGLCIIMALSFPSEYYIPTPPEVSNYYMANLKQKERVKRISSGGKVLTTKKLIYDDSQMSFA